MALTRIFFTTDIHGSETVFRRFLNAGSFYKANVVIMGGDITGKIIVPLVEQPHGTYKVNYQGADLVLRSREEIEDIEKKIRSDGYYPYRTAPIEVEEMRADKEKMDKVFSRLMIETMQRWILMAEERLKGTGVKCFISPGNDDRFDIDDVLKASTYITYPEGKVVQIDDYHEMISCGFSNITPWNAPRDISEEKLAEKISSMASQVSRMSNCIFNLHCPPFDSRIDTAPALDETLRPVTQPGAALMIPVGSVSVRNAIQRYQPLLGLHGHIHESRGVAKIGRTLCANPGSEYLEGILRGALVNLDAGRIKSYQLISG